MEKEGKERIHRTLHLLRTIGLMITRVFPALNESWHPDKQSAPRFCHGPAYCNREQRHHQFLGYCYRDDSCTQHPRMHQVVRRVAVSHYWELHGFLHILSGLSQLVAVKYGAPMPQQPSTGLNPMNYLRVVFLVGLAIASS
jgi:hypothetical protein